MAVSGFHLFLQYRKTLRRRRGPRLVEPTKISTKVRSAVLRTISPKRPALAPLFETVFLDSITAGCGQAMEVYQSVRKIRRHRHRIQEWETA